MDVSDSTDLKLVAVREGRQCRGLGWMEAGDWLRSPMKNHPTEENTKKKDIGRKDCKQLTMNG